MSHDSTGCENSNGSNLWQFAFNLPLIVRRFWMSDVNRYVADMAELQPGERAIDIGAGLGPATMRAAETQPEAKIIAFDPSSTMRFVTNLRRLAKRNHRQIRVRYGVAEELPIASQSADIGWSVNTVHHFGDLNDAMAEISRVLKPGGRLLLVEEDFDHPDHEFYAMSDDHEPYDENTMNGLLIAEITSAMSSAGFDEIDISRPFVKGIPVIQIRAVRDPISG